MFKFIKSFFPSLEALPKYRSVLYDSGREVLEELVLDPEGYELPYYKPCEEKVVKIEYQVEP